MKTAAADLRIDLNYLRDRRGDPATRSVLEAVCSAVQP